MPRDRGPPVAFRLKQSHLKTPMCCTIFYKLYNVNQKTGKHGSTVKIIEVIMSRKSIWKEKKGGKQSVVEARGQGYFKKGEGSIVNCNGAAKKNED